MQEVACVKQGCACKVVATTVTLTLAYTVPALSRCLPINGFGYTTSVNASRTRLIAVQEGRRACPILPLTPCSRRAPGFAV